MAERKKTNRLKYQTSYSPEPMPIEQQVRIERLLARMVARAIFAEQQAMLTEQSSLHELENEP